MADEPTTTKGKDYGPHQLVSAQLLTLPEWTKRGLVTTPVQDNHPALLRGLGGPVRNRRLLGYRYHPYRRNAPLPPPMPLPPLPPPPLPPIAAVGQMDIGQGNCTLLYDQALEPVIYYDTGYPLNFYINSAPVNIRPANPAYLGPILQNTAGNLSVVLSHWDWDHWRLGALTPLNALPWLVPTQAMGPAALGFLGGIAGVMHNPLIPLVLFPGYTVYQCQPAGPMMPAGLMNNTGLALAFLTNLPTGDPVWHEVVLTGDANFDSVPPLQGAGYPNVTGIAAVHHGSIAHGAAANLPNPVGPYALTGRIAYSYGVRQSAAGAWVHCYGFPVPAAVGNYHAAGWNNEAATAEAAINGPLPPAARGNIRMGNQGASPVGGGTAFAAIQFALV